MFREHHQLNGHEFEQTSEDSGGWRSLACCSPQGGRVRHNLSTHQQQEVSISSTWRQQRTVKGWPGGELSLGCQQVMRRSKHFHLLPSRSPMASGVSVRSQSLAFFVSPSYHQGNWVTSLKIRPGMTIRDKNRPEVL